MHENAWLIQLKNKTNFNQQVMVGYDPNEINLTQTQQVIVSGFTSILSRCLIQPLDLIKIRFQVCFS